MSITSLNQKSLELLCEKIKNKKYFLLGESTMEPMNSIQI